MKRKNQLLDVDQSPAPLKKECIKFQHTFRHVWGYHFGTTHLGACPSVALLHQGWDMIYDLPALVPLSTLGILPFAFITAMARR